MTINRANITKQLIPGLNKVFGLSYGEIDQEHTVLFETENSDRSFEEEVLMSGLGEAPVKSEGAPVSYDSAEELWTSRYVHETIALGFAITEEAMEDNLYDSFAKIRAKSLGRSMASTKQVKAANVFNTAFSTNGGDGVPLFSSAHPTLAAGNQDNLGSADLSETALEDAYTDISLFEDDRGILIGAQAKSLHIPPQLRFVAHKILNSNLSTTVFTVGTDGATNVNDTNALKDMGAYRGYFVNHRFTDPDAWFIKTDVPNSTKHFVRVKLGTKSEGDFDTGNIRFKARERYSFGYSDWRGWWGSPGAG